nr:T9SS type A sorting domain-containing protein [Terrimonas ginsenosidimutans]
MISKVYPNPVVKGKEFKVEFQSDAVQSLQVRIFNLNGTQLSSRSYHSMEGVNRMEIPVPSHWASGLYAVQVIDDNGELVIQTKVVVQ